MAERRGDEFDAAQRRLEEIRRRLSSADDRRSLSAALDALAALAASDEPALHLLLEEIVDRRLAEVSIRAVFFDEASVDDAVQETVLAVAAGIGGFRGESSFLTWLDRVARNAAAQIRRRRQRMSEPISYDVPTWPPRPDG